MSAKPVVQAFKIKPTAYVYQAKLVEVVDGDTVKLEMKKSYVLDIDFGFHIVDQMSLHKTARQTCRLLGINAPEVAKDTKEAGLKAKEALKTLLESGNITATISKQDKYGRWLVTLAVAPPGNEPIDAAQWMIDKGYAVPYNP